MSQQNDSPNKKEDIVHPQSSVPGQLNTDDGDGATAESDPSSDIDECAPAESDPSSHVYEGASAEHDPSSNIDECAPAEPDPSSNVYEGAPAEPDPSSITYDGAPAESNPSAQTTPRVRPASASGQSDEFLPDANQAPHDGADRKDERGQPPSASIVDDPNQPLEAFDWDDLEARFCAKMEECKKVEEEIGEEFRRWVEVFKAWASCSPKRDTERAHKRLKTRMAWVQMAEEGLEEKRQHYIKVVQAFENALALLADS